MKKVRCPVCKEWSEWKDNPFKPFCSEKCKKRDLGNWATEAYRISGSDDEKEDPGPDPKSKPEE
jgi:uncharacterized protein